MEAFACPSCGSRVHFDSLVCEHCGAALSYDVDLDHFELAGQTCSHRDAPELCNWSAGGGRWCASCVLDVDHAPSALRQPFERAKRRVVRQCHLLGIRLDREPDVRFDLREGTPESPVLTGHADGLITLNTAEGRPEELAAVKTSMGEPYRTPLGHVRHELGHWYWASHGDLSFSLESFRTLFGDERADYAAALEAHYSGTDDGSWRDDHISFYAASHPWEDFAESFAHALHILDTSETAKANGMPQGWSVQESVATFDDAYADWVDLTVVINELDRSMGTPDAYPFAVSPRAVDKIRFVVESFRAVRAE